MKVSQVFDSGEFLKAEDLQDREPVVAIAKVDMKQFDDGNKLVISFQNAKKRLVANKTNANRIVLLYGDDTDQWVGKEIKLYVDIVDFRGEAKRAIRVKPPGKPQPNYSVQSGAQVRDRDANPPARDDMDDQIPF